MMVCSGGRLDVNLMMPGKLADFRMWDRALSDEEVLSLSCAASDDTILTLDDFEIVGTQQMSNDGDFQCSEYCVIDNVIVGSQTM